MEKKDNVLASEDDIEPLHKSIELYAMKYKDVYRCCVGIEDYHISDMSQGIPTFEDVISRVRLDRKTNFTAGPNKNGTAGDKLGDASLVSYR